MSIWDLEFGYQKLKTFGDKMDIHRREIEHDCTKERLPLILGTFVLTRTRTRVVPRSVTEFDGADI